MVAAQMEKWAQEQPWLQCGLCPSSPFTTGLQPMFFCRMVNHPSAQNSRTKLMTILIVDLQRHSLSPNRMNSVILPFQLWNQLGKWKQSYLSSSWSVVQASASTLLVLDIDIIRTITYNFPNEYSRWWRFLPEFFFRSLPEANATTLTLSLWLKAQLFTE